MISGNRPRGEEKTGDVFVKLAYVPENKSCKIFCKPREQERGNKFQSTKEASMNKDKLKTLLILLLCGFISTGLIGCPSDDDDDDDLVDIIEDADDADDAIDDAEDAIDDAEDAIDDATDEVDDAVDDIEPPVTDNGGRSANCQACVDGCLANPLSAGLSEEQCFQVCVDGFAPFVAANTCP